MRQILNRLGAPINIDPTPTQATATREVTYVKLVRGTEVKYVYRWAKTPTTAIVPSGFGGQADHHNHFHVYLRSPTEIVKIAPNVSQNLDAADDMPGFGNQGEKKMASFDITFEQGREITASVILASAKESGAVAKTLWTGGYVLLDSVEKGVTWDPAKEACDELHDLGWFRGEELKSRSPNCKVIKLESLPKHGKVEQLSDGSFKYVPNKGYLGKDRMQFIVDAEGIKIRIMWSASVVETEPRGENDASTKINTNLARLGSIDSWWKLAKVSDFLAAISGVDYSFEQLSGASVGKTQLNSTLLSTKSL